MVYLYPHAKSIYDPVLLSLDVLDLKVKLIDRGQPSSLPGIHIWLLKQVPQPNVVTHQYKPSVKKLVPPHIYGMNDPY